MSDSIADILAKKRHEQPDEIGKIKQFVEQRVGVKPQVFVTKTAFIVSIPSAAAAAALRFELFRLERQLGSTRKIILKIV